MEGTDRNDRSCEVWRNSTSLQANRRLRHRGTDEREGGGGRKMEREREGSREGGRGRGRERKGQREVDSGI